MKTLERVPWLTAEDMCHEFLDEGETHCLLGWANVVAGGDYMLVSQICDALCKFLGKFSVGTHNDTHTLQQNANTWNAMWAARGFTEDDGEMEI